MNKQMKKTFLSLIIPLTVFGCDRWDQQLTIINRTSDTIFATISLDGSFREHPIKMSEGDTLWTHIRFISPNDSIRPLSVEGMSWEETVNKEGKDSIVTIFIFENETLTFIPADSLVPNQLCSKKYSYKVKDLKKLDWRIEYKE